jgi:hypothetical protein
MPRALLHRLPLLVKTRERLWEKHLGRPSARRRVKLWARLLEMRMGTA